MDGHCGAASCHVTCFSRPQELNVYRILISHHSKEVNGFTSTRHNRELVPVRFRLETEECQREPKKVHTAGCHVSGNMA
jgi:hypothetical protein